MQQQLDAESVQLLIGLLNESQVPNNEKQQEIHQVCLIFNTFTIFFSK